MRVIDREETKLVAGFRSTTRANARLLALTRSGYLERRFVGTIAGGRKGVYFLSAKAAALFGIRHSRVPGRLDRNLGTELFVEHQKCVNSIFLAMKYRPISNPEVRLRKWIRFREPLTKGSRIIPDAYFELDSPAGIQSMFLEADLGTETSTIWKRKIEAYVRLAISGEFRDLFHQQRFRVLVVTKSERRSTTIQAVIARRTGKIFWLSTFESINRDGLWSPIWLRPRGNQRHSLV